MEAKKHHVLYVEDHEDTRELVRLIFESLDCRITTSSSCTEGFQLARQHKFDLYLLNSWLPDGSGVELCRKLRQFDPGTPVIFLSAAAFEVDKQMAISSGANRYLVKPMDINLLGSETIALLKANHKEPRSSDCAPKSLAMAAGNG